MELDESIYQMEPKDRPYGQRGRYPKPPYYPKTAEGLKPCRWCRKPGQRNFCRDCLHEYFLHADWKTIAKSIIERDKVCRICGGGRYNVTIAALHYTGDPGLIDGKPWSHWCSEAREGRDDARPRACRLQITWEVDHLLAVSQGGTDRPDNLRLLCGRCHREVTSAQLALWAQRRREALKVASGQSDLL